MMTNAAGYNGWKNRQTWNVNLWLMNEEPLYRECVALAEDCRKHKVVVGPLAAKHFAQRVFGPATPEGIRLADRAIDWKAIAESINECA